MKRLAALTLVAAVGTPALAGQVHHRGATLDKVLLRTDLVVTIALDTPHSRSAAIPVPPAGDKNCGTYDYGVITGTVVSVQHPQAPVVSPGERIVVYFANTPSLVELTHLACSEGTSKSPIFDRFEGAAPADGATLTALLRWEKGFGWTEAVAGSWLKAPPTAKQLALARAPGFDEDLAAHEAMCVDDKDCVLGTLACGPCGPCVEPQPVARAALGRYGALCRQAGKAADGCGGCGDVGDPRAPRRRPVCRAMRCATEVERK